jgi:transaldolase
MKKLIDLKIQIYADGADLEEMILLNRDPLISGLTTNPTLMRRAGINNYEDFAKTVLEHVTIKPISFEVFSDDFPDMIRQADKISKWGNNVYVKIPVVNSIGESTTKVIKELSQRGIKVNATAIMTNSKAVEIADAICPAEGIISIFCGRITDTLSSPLYPNKKIGLEKYLWASTREVWNIVQAEKMGYDVITVPGVILKKAREMELRDLDQLSLETVQMFKRDSEGYVL